MTFADWLLLTLATFGAALVQSSTGFGFGLLVVPVYLLVLDAVEAVQINIIVTLLISFSIMSTIWGESDKVFMRRFMIGNLPGLPAGLAIYAFASLFYLKLLAAGVILAFAALILGQRLRRRTRFRPPPRRPPARVDYLCSLVAGFLAPSLGVPGAAVLAYFADSPLHEKVIRGTSLTSVLFVQTTSLGLQIAAGGIAPETLWITAGVLPFGILGGYAGLVAGRHVNKRRFQSFAVALLIATGAYLLYATLAAPT